MKEKILIIGATGQIGTELTEALRGIYGVSHVVPSDIRHSDLDVFKEGPFEVLDVTDKEGLFAVVKKYEITQVYLLAAMLSATAERHMEAAWRLNMNGLSNVLELARDKHIKQIYWPSSIAVFGPNTPKELTPQNAYMDPNTVYGISKRSGELWCTYYFEKFGVDVRSLRYPGIISWKSDPGGGTTDYAIHMYHEALTKGRYTSFLNQGSMLPMMYMPDAIRATLELMHADADKVKCRNSYNLAGFSFAPEDLGESIRKLIPGFSWDYAPDYRQAIADSWPGSIDDSVARSDWGWKHQYELDDMSADMLKNLKEVRGIGG